MSAPEPPLAALPVHDQESVMRTLESLRTGFMNRDADALVDVYSDDADWINAFGSVKKGGSEIVDYLRGLFADANFDAGVVEGPPELTFRVLTPDVVLVTMHVRVAGQKLISGGAIPERNNYSLRVLCRQPDDRWLIESEMFMDANPEQTYVGHSSAPADGDVPSNSN